MRSRDSGIKREILPDRVILGRFGKAAREVRQGQPIAVPWISAGNLCPETVLDSIDMMDPGCNHDWWVISKLEGRRTLKAGVWMPAES